MTGSEQEDVYTSNKIRILSLVGKFAEDHKRVRVNLKLSDASERPTAHLALLDPDGNIISSAVVLDLLFPILTFTLHLEKYPAGLPVQVSVRICNDKDVLLDEKMETVT